MDVHHKLSAVLRLESTPTVAERLTEIERSAWIQYSHDCVLQANTASTCQYSADSAIFVYWYI